MLLPEAKPSYKGRTQDIKTYIYIGSIKKTTTSNDSEIWKGGKANQIEKKYLNGIKKAVYKGCKDTQGQKKVYKEVQHARNELESKKLQ